MRKLFSLLLVFVLLMLVMPSAYAQGLKTKFKDVPAGSWYEKYVSKLVVNKNKIILGYSATKFGPTDNVLVAQFATMVLRSMGYTNLKYYMGYIDKAIELGLIKTGEYDSYARVITRGEIARMITRAMKDEPEPANLNDYKVLIKDYDSIHDNLKKDVLKVYYMGIVEGGPGGYNAGGNTSRASACKVILAMIEPSERSVVELKVDDKTVIVNGYTIPLNEHGNSRAITDKEVLGTGVELRYNVNLYKDDIAEQLVEIRNILASKFGSSLADEVINYCKQKTELEYELPSKTFQTYQNKFIGVHGYSRSSQITITVSYIMR